MNINILFLLLVAVWIYLLSVLKRAKIHFWYFVLGSVGLFVVMLLVIEPLATSSLSQAVASAVGILGETTGICQSYFRYGMLFINTNDVVISLYIDYECAGIIEIMAFSALLWFFPVYQFYEKVVVDLLGILWIIGANVLRIFVICLMVYQWGESIYYFAHTIFGRIIFYGLSVILYYVVFTKAQVIRQKVGSFKYANH